MSATSERPSNEQARTYDRASSVVFLKTDAPFGGLSNMAGGFPLHVHGTRIYTSEALYQACRFPHLPEVQGLIIGQASPMTAKMKSKPHRKNSRPDWDRVRVKVMRWCLRMKLAQNWATFSDLLLLTGDRPIVEESRRDDFWGARPVDEQTLVGMNVLGRLLMELRDAVKAQGPAGFQAVEPLDIPEFLFLGLPIGTLGAHELRASHAGSTSTAGAPDHAVKKRTAVQGLLFDAPAARAGSAPAYSPSPTPESTQLSELKPYPAMKDSGVPWLGEVPEHWGTASVKRHYAIQLGKML
ncbi:MAG: NADAR family protein, partial [Betaproteobacteria bacterium]|nr:NADAR family protein [Betaproteobacteria bacterium]